MLKTMFNTKYNTGISSYSKLQAYLKKFYTQYTPKKAKVFSPAEIRKNSIDIYIRSS